MDDFLHHALNVVVALGGIEHTILSSTLAMGVVGLENRSPTLTLGPDNATHLQQTETEQSMMTTLVAGLAVQTYAAASVRHRPCMTGKSLP